MTASTTETQDAKTFQTAIIAQLPTLRAFAVSLCGDRDRADDFVQETLIRAWTYRTQFTEGTNLRAWLFTILRNRVVTNYRKHWREVEDVDGIYSGSVVVQPDQMIHLEFEDFRTALDKLSLEHREALILICASGMSYEEAAEVCGCAVGTMKSRVNRARSLLKSMLSDDADVRTPATAAPELKIAV